jgi:hypothetical protein
LQVLKKTIKAIHPKTNDDASMMYYFSEILRSDVGMPGASEISKRLSINLERLENN